MLRDVMLAEVRSPCIPATKSGAPLVWPGRERRVIAELEPSPPCIAYLSVPHASQDDTHYLAGRPNPLASTRLGGQERGTVKGM